MSSEKRLVFTLVLCIASVWGIQFLMERTGLIKPAAPEPPPAVAKDDLAKAKPKEAPKLVEADKPKGELPDNPFAPDPKVEPPAVKKPGVKLAMPWELVLGADDDESPSAYHLRLQLNQRGASVDEATSAKYDAEYDPNLKVIQGRMPRLKLINDELAPDAPGSVSLTVISAEKAARPMNADPEDLGVEPPKVEAPLDLVPWEVVREKDDAPAVRKITRTDPRSSEKIEGQEIAFRTTAADPAVTVTKIFRIWKGEDGFDVELRFSSPSKDSKFSYKLYSPHGIPIEGEWYTSMFRDVFFGQANPNGSTTEPTPISSTDIVKNPDANHQLVLPLKFAGVEDQYFTTLVQPLPIPMTQDDRKEKDSWPVVFLHDKLAPQKSDVGVAILSTPILVGPNLGEVVHKFRIYAGPKLATALEPYQAEKLASYRKQWIPIPGAPELAKYVIAPLLDKIYDLTKSIARLFGWKNGNYGIAIILLTMTVRLIMFPLGRKQAMMAKQMQDLQPIIAEVKEKYKDDKEALTRETMAVWKRHKVNPAAGCLPALIQMPIFVGLWQTLNNSVALRHSSFLYIRDLAAPDMLFKFPTTIPLLGDYFNLLPFFVVALMLVQTKLFSPPPTTPEAEMNQKMMKYMMIFMAFMFYKVPSGLGLYFITSSTWQICERLLLPKVIHTPAKPASQDEDLGGDRGKGGGGGSNGSGPNGNGKGGGAQGWLGRRLEKLLEEAAKDSTIRNVNRDPDRDRGSRERERERDRDRPRPKPKPGKRR